MEENLDQRYQTGAVEPPKGHGGIVAALLIAVISLAGICAVMGVMDLKLLEALKEQTDSELALSQCTDEPQDQAPDGTVSATLPGEEVTPVYQNYYGLPAGIYVNDHCGTARGGICRGDILLSVNGQRITTEMELLDAIRAYRSGDQVTVVVYREDREVTLTLTVEGEP